MNDSAPRVTREIRGSVLALGLNRADKLNAFDLRALRELAEAITEFEADSNLRCAVLFGHGKSFTSGLDLAEVGPAVQSGQALFPEGLVDPLGLHGRRRTKPLVMAVRGWCLTIGIELLLAADIRVAAKDTRFGQIEINRGIFPFGGATLRLPQVAGWGNAMRWLLTGDEFDAEEALRIGLVQQITDTGQELEVALEIASTVARRAPLGVQATLESAWHQEAEGFDAARGALLSQARKLMQSEDAAEGLRSFVERREAAFKGR
ncbi:MAG: crotonase/enoyl-CoA hydratase family protein [Polyangiaceae bacterium]